MTFILQKNQLLYYKYIYLFLFFQLHTSFSITYSKNAYKYKQCFILRGGYNNDIYNAKRFLAYTRNDIENARSLLQEDENKIIDQSDNNIKTKAVKSDLPTQFLSLTENIEKEGIIYITEPLLFRSHVIDSPVPVLLLIYSDSFKPCRLILPILEEMTIKSNGKYRLVKLNINETKHFNDALNVKYVPTMLIFNNGLIINKIEGIPKSKDMDNFFISLTTGFFPNNDDDIDIKYRETSKSLVKISCINCMSFLQREKLQEATKFQLNKVVKECRDNSTIERTVHTIQCLLCNVINNPFESKYQRVNFLNKCISTNVCKYPGAVNILKNVGFEMVGDSEMIMKTKGEVAVVAPCVVVRDVIEKWMDMRKQKDLEKILIKEKSQDIFKKNINNIIHIKLRIDDKK